MPNGKQYLMTSSWMHMNMALFCYVPMARRDGFTFAYLHTQPTILKSKHYCSLQLPTLTCSRILMASIRNLGDCPCPRCKIKLFRVHNLGMSMDRTQRRTQARVDDEIRRKNVLKARSLIYKHGHIINSAEIERLLKPESLVPTAVSLFIY